jgi:tetratricopeptide (TPR) repeat protein
MKTLKTLLIVVFLFLLGGNATAQVENILKTAIPELYAELKITPETKYDKSKKDDYRTLYYKLEDAYGDVQAMEYGSATQEVMKILDYKELKNIEKENKLDSLKAVIKAHQEAINDLMKFHERYAADSVNVGIYYNGFKDNWEAYKKNKDEKSLNAAYSNWSVLFHRYPLISYNVVYVAGAKVLKIKIKKSADSTERANYIDTLFQLYNQQIMLYPDKEAYVKGKMVVDYHNYFIKGNDLNDSIIRTKMYENYKMAMEAIDKGGEKTKYYVFPIAMKLSVFEYMLDSISADKALDNYLTFSDILNKQYSTEENQKKKDAIKKKGIDLVDAIFSKSDLSTCEHLCPTFQTKFERDPENIDNLTRIFATLSSKGCTDCQLYTDVAVAIYKIEPDATTAHGLAILYASKENYDEAAKYFDDAIKMEKVDTLKAQYYFEAAKLYNKQKQYGKAREYARNALNLNPNLGNAYILIATMYAATANSVGDDQFAHNAVFWAAVDKLIQAKKVDPSVSEDADKLISTYSAHFPKKEEGFMHSVLEGQSYTVGGWIQEVTSARYYK